jgi:hypothetical protein
MDHGTLGLDAYYDVHQRFFDLMMRDKGYTGLNYAAESFPALCTTRPPGPTG